MVKVSPMPGNDSVPPSITSRPSPAFHITVSLSAPALIMSLPLPPAITSSPASAFTVSAPPRASKMSSPVVPLSVAPPPPLRMLSPTMRVLGSVTMVSRLPKLSVNETTARSNWPTCACAGVKLAVVAPAIGVHGPGTPPPVSGATCHWKVRASGPGGKPLASAIADVFTVRATVSLGDVSLSRASPVAGILTALGTRSPSAKRKISMLRSVSTPSESRSVAERTNPV